MATAETLAVAIFGHRQILRISRPGAVDEDTDAMMMGWLWVVVVTMDNGYVVIIMMMMPLIMLLIMLILLMLLLGQ